MAMDTDYVWPASTPCIHRAERNFPEMYELCKNKQTLHICSFPRFQVVREPAWHFLTIVALCCHR